MMGVPPVLAGDAAVPRSYLDTLRLANPCPASWEAMAGDDRVRFCPDCRLHVYNLSAMSRAEAEAFLRQREGRVCLRFFRRADGTVLTQDCPVGLRAARRRLGLVVGAAAAALLACLALLAGFFGETRHRQEAVAWLRQAEPFRTGRQVEPFKSVLEWLDPTPADCTMGW
jgi:hypothetical protein